MLTIHVSSRRYCRLTRALAAVWGCPPHQSWGGWRLTSLLNALPVATDPQRGGS